MGNGTKLTNGTINGTKLLNTFDILEVDMSKRTAARSLLRRPNLSFIRTTNI